MDFAAPSRGSWQMLARAASATTPARAGASCRRPPRRRGTCLENRRYRPAAPQFPANACRGPAPPLGRITDVTNSQQHQGQQRQCGHAENGDPPQQPAGRFVAQFGIADAGRDVFSSGGPVDRAGVGVVWPMSQAGQGWCGPCPRLGRGGVACVPGRAGVVGSVSQAGQGWWGPTQSIKLLGVIFGSIGC